MVMEMNTSNNSFVDGSNGPSVIILELVINLTFALVGSSTCILNGIVILGFIKERRVRETLGNVFILNLAISDILNGIFIIYMVVLNLCKFNNDYEYLFRMGFIVSFCLSSAFFLSFLTIDRYMKIKMHLRYESLVTTRTHHVVCGIAWVSCIIAGLLPLVGWHNPNVRSQSYFETFPASYVVGMFAVGFILSIAPLVFVYTSLYLISRNHARKIACQSQTGEMQRRSENGKGIKSILILVGVYLFCWLPGGIYCMVGASLGRDPNTTRVPVFTVFVTLGFINSFLNPLIYATKIDEIRAYFRKVCCPCRKPNNNTTGVVSGSVDRKQTSQGEKLSTDMTESKTRKPECPSV